VTCIPIKSWIARAAGENIECYLNAETNSDNLALKVYLPQGRETQFPWKDIIKLKLGQVVLKIKTKRADLNLSDAIAQDLLGNELDINKTVEELDLKQICFGIDIVDWILYVEKEKNNNNNELSDPLDKKGLIDYFFNLNKQAMTRRDKNSSGLKSPPRKNLVKSSALISISEQLQNLKLNDPIQLSTQLTAQVTSFWHVQHFYLDDEKHFDHYSEIQNQFKYTYMVPFPFLESVPARKKPWQKVSVDLHESHEEKSSLKHSHNPTEDFLMMGFDTNQSSYEEFINQMESKVNEKRNELKY